MTNGKGREQRAIALGAQCDECMSTPNLATSKSVLCCLLHQVQKIKYESTKPYFCAYRVRAIICLGTASRGGTSAKMEKTAVHFFKFKNAHTNTFSLSLIPLPAQHTYIICAHTGVSIPWHVLWNTC
ncbi:hypothetical protein DUNSADRAFT_15025 [Dunaliella salina]|uniref:Encoded protein n=1 Tax=Dunaliella salina TaxID=3046 RepID=A0ABQ7G675_DUNSA|nr:hypothetical protein DUNSADRAFT_15025 [Dunaliella salina]|eukprot:KAF5830108.1 hypothetical protein DUNSADRAFT_15025 [Dunaliella salina]